VWTVHRCPASPTGTRGDWRETSSFLCIWDANCVWDAMATLSIVIQCQFSCFTQVKREEDDSSSHCRAIVRPSSSSPEFSWTFSFLVLLEFSDVSMCFRRSTCFLCRFFSHVIVEEVVLRPRRTSAMIICRLCAGGESF